MAGLSSRFKNAGYDLPKYMLEAHGKTLFSHSLESFNRYFSHEFFLFVVIDVFNSVSFVKDQCSILGIKNYSVVCLNGPTGGQAETVFLGLKHAEVSADEPLLIFNIDTFRPGFSWPSELDLKCIDGYLETFIGSGANWSNVLPADPILKTVKLTAEKQEASEYCCTGLYYWRRCSDFCEIFERYQKKHSSDLQGGEYYIAPMYNDLISDGKDVRYTVIDSDQVIFCGVPKEYISFLSS